MPKPTMWPVHPAKTQISLGIRPVWSEYSLCAQWVAKDPSFLHAVSEDSDRTGRMPRLIWVFAGRTYHLVGFVMRRLKCSVKTLFSVIRSHAVCSLIIYLKYNKNVHAIDVHRERGSKGVLSVVSKVVRSWTKKNPHTLRCPSCKSSSIAIKLK